MYQKKEFWFALFFVLCFIVSIVDLLNQGFATFRICIIGLSAFFAVLFFRQAAGK